MPIPIPSREPEQFVGGQTLKWTKSLPDYLPTDSWVLKYHCTRDDGGLTAIVLTATDNGDGSHLINVAANTFTKGNWYWQARVTKGAEALVVEQGRFLVRADISAGAVDDRSHAEKALAALEAVLNNKATQDQLSYSIANRSISRMTPQELRDWRDYYRGEIAQIVQAERLARGLGHGGKIRVWL